MDKTNVDYLIKRLEKALTDFPHRIGDGDINLELKITIKKSTTQLMKQNE